MNHQRENTFGEHEDDKVEDAPNPALSTSSKKTIVSLFKMILSDIQEIRPNSSETEELDLGREPSPFIVLSRILEQ